MLRNLLTVLFVASHIAYAVSAVPEAPELQVMVEGPKIKISWNESPNSTGYNLYYAPYPAGEPVELLHMGKATEISGLIYQDQAAFYVGVEPYNSEGSGMFSNIENFETSYGNLFYPPAGQITVCTFTEPNFSADFTCELVDFESYGYGELADYTVNGDVIYVDPEVRKLELQLLDQNALETLCAKDVHLALGSYANYTSVPISGINYSENKQPVFDMQATSLYGRLYHHYLDYEHAGGMILRSLLAWAEGNGMMSADFPYDPGAALDTKNLLHDMVLAWRDIRNEEFVSDSDRQVINSYIESLAIKTSVEEGYWHGLEIPSGLDVFNQGWQRDVATMAYGVAFNDSYYFQKGIARFFAILDGQIRPDGSIFFESQRGGSALGYSINATIMLIRMAEMAAVQGYDLYSVEVDGLSLDDVIEFTMSALEDNSVLYQYTENNTAACSPEQCDKWHDQTYGYTYDLEIGNFQFADFEIYKRRFPDSPFVARFDSLFPPEQYNPLIFKGINGSCEFRKLN